MNDCLLFSPHALLYATGKYLGISNPIHWLAHDRKRKEKNVGLVYFAPGPLSVTAYSKNEFHVEEEGTVLYVSAGKKTFGFGLSWDYFWTLSHTRLAGAVVVQCACVLIERSCGVSAEGLYTGTHEP